MQKTEDSIKTGTLRSLQRVRLFRPGNFRDFLVFSQHGLQSVQRPTYAIRCGSFEDFIAGKCKSCGQRKCSLAGYNYRPFGNHKDGKMFYQTTEEVKDKCARSTVFEFRTFGKRDLNIDGDKKLRAGTLGKEIKARMTNDLVEEVLFLAFKLLNRSLSSLLRAQTLLFLKQNSNHQRLNPSTCYNRFKTEDIFIRSPDPV